MANASTKPFSFICGPDDFLVARAGRERFDQLVAAANADEFSREVISGFATNVGEVESAINRFRESVQTVSMFGGQRVVWLKDINFLADTVTGRAESTLKLVADLQELLATINPAETAVLLTASPIDRRRAFPKWCEKESDFLLTGGDGDGASDALTAVVLAEARTLGVSYGLGAVELLLAKVGPNTRLLIEETHKLATYIDLPTDPTANGKRGAVIEEKHVAELTPNVAEGDFFEAAEAFFSGDLQWTLKALERHFFNGGDARPIISALQNRNRILLQIRALMESGELRLGPRGLDANAFKACASAYGQHFTGAGEKSSYNLFTQNPWYLGKLASGAKLPSLKRLIDKQLEFITAFEQIVARPDEQEDVLRDMTVRCLAR